MRDFSHYAGQGVHSGRTVAYEVTELVNEDGTHPILHVEHLGSANVSLTEEAIIKAGAEAPDATGPLDRDQALRETIVKHAARRIECAYFSDGTAASDADIHGFVQSLPTAAFVRLASFAMNEANFCKRPAIATPPGELAEK